MSKATELKAAQSVCKAGYLADGDSAKQVLSACGMIDPDNLACRIQHPSVWDPAGLHSSGGGDGTFACPVEIMLAGWVSCAGVTLCAVASSMQIVLESGKITAEGSIDFRGTLAVDRAAPVGLTGLRLIFELKTDAPADKVQKLIELTQRYCVVHRTLESPPQMEVVVITS